MLDTTPVVCPHCHSSLVYSYTGSNGVSREYSRAIGVEVPGTYDGILYWQCPDCGHRWHRWPVHSPMQYAAQPYIDRGLL